MYFQLRQNIAFAAVCLGLAISACTAKHTPIPLELFREVKLGSVAEVKRSPEWKNLLDATNSKVAFDRIQDAFPFAFETYKIKNLVLFNDGNRPVAYSTSAQQKMIFFIGEIESSEKNHRGLFVADTVQRKTFKLTDQYDLNQKRLFYRAQWADRKVVLTAPEFKIQIFDSAKDTLTEILCNSCAAATLSKDGQTLFYSKSILQKATIIHPAGRMLMGFRTLNLERMLIEDVTPEKDLDTGSITHALWLKDGEEIILGGFLNGFFGTGWRLLDVKRKTISPLKFVPRDLYLLSEFQLEWKVPAESFYGCISHCTYAEKNCSCVGFLFDLVNRTATQVSTRENPFQY